MGTARSGSGYISLAHSSTQHTDMVYTSLYCQGREQEGCHGGHTRITACSTWMDYKSWQRAAAVTLISLALLFFHNCRL